MLPSISPTFEWIRLAERIPVRVHIDDVPEGVDLRVGTTASMWTRTGMRSARRIHSKVGLIDGNNS